MKNLIIALIIGLLLFGASFAGSSFLLTQQQKAEEEKEDGDETTDELADASATDDQAARPVSVDSDDLAVPFKPTTLSEEAILNMARELRAQKAQLDQQRLVVKEREDRNEFIRKDIARQKRELEAMQQQVQLKIQEANRLFEAVQQKQNEIEQTRADIEAMQQVAPDGNAPQSSVEKAGMQKVVEMLNASSTERAALYVQEFVDGGQQDLVVEYLRQLDGSKISKILAEVQDQKLAKDLIEAIHGRRNAGNRPAIR